MNCNVIYVALFTPLQHGFTLKNIPKFIDQLKKLYKKTIDILARVVNARLALYNVSVLLPTHMSIFSYNIYISSVFSNNIFHLYKIHLDRINWNELSIIIMI